MVHEIFYAGIFPVGLHLTLKYRSVLGGIVEVVDPEDSGLYP